MSTTISDFRKQLQVMESKANEIQSLVDGFKKAIPQMLAMLDNIEQGIKFFSGMKEHEKEVHTSEVAKTPEAERPATLSADVIKSTLSEIFQRIPIIHMNKLYDEFGKIVELPKNGDLLKKAKDQIRFTVYNLDRAKQLVKPVAIPGKKRSGVWARIDYAPTQQDIQSFK